MRRHDRGSRPVWGTSVHSLERATQALLRLLYTGQLAPDVPQSNKTPEKVKRNAEIKRRYAEGESVPDLAREFGISEQRVHQILRGRRK